MSALVDILWERNSVEAIIAALSKIGGPSVPPLLRRLGEALGSSRNHTFVEVAERALVKIGEPTIPPLCDLLRDLPTENSDGKGNTPEVAARVLSQIAQHSQSPALRTALPFLRRRLRLSSNETKEASRVYRTAIRRIQDAVGK